MEARRVWLDGRASVSTDRPLLCTPGHLPARASVLSGSGYPAAKPERFAFDLRFMARSIAKAPAESTRVGDHLISVDAALLGAEHGIPSAWHTSGRIRC